jgi:shikimate dehydrogenase
MDDMPPVYGLIGYPLTHSFSPAYFHRKFGQLGIDAAYESFPLSDITDFSALLQTQPALRGLNVTIPYKSAIIPYLNAVTDEAGSIGAVNCIDIRDGVLTGYNTDAGAFERSLNPLLRPHHRKALVLGTGGASLAVRYALSAVGIAWVSVSRSKKDGAIPYSSLNHALLAAHTIIINTTPLGMYPDTDQYPDIPYELLSEAHLLYDLIYNPEETGFLQKGKAQGATTKNGLEMLQLQAEASWDIWNR